MSQSFNKNDVNDPGRDRRTAAGDQPVAGRRPPQHRPDHEPRRGSTRRRRRILSLVQDALSQLRLDMKYLMFDLEATRRERDEYRRKVEEA